MITTRSTKLPRRPFLQKVRVESDQRTPEQVREHYQIEKELANRLRESSREERSTLYASLYDELHRRVPFVTEQQSSESTTGEMSPQWRFLRRFLRKETVFLEIGAGNCITSLAAAKLVKKVYAMEVSEEAVKSVKGPENFELILSGGPDIPLPAESVSIVYSHQVMEHIHSDDAVEQLIDIYRMLMKGGIYICVTPNRLSGPYDISKYFDEVATGFHLKEYTNTDLSDLFKKIGFSKVNAYSGAMGIYVRCPLFALRLLESLLGRLPHRTRRTIAGLLLLVNIRLVGIKK